jgi:Zn finger protein HypA/HybF involved in hydrogenase expression
MEAGMKAHGLICDKCHRQFEVIAGERLFVQEAYLKVLAVARGWYFANSKKHYCPECSNKNIGRSE